jgi:predicted PurR-regulated permease PerM
MRAAAPRIEIPRWIQLVTLPLILLLVWAVAGAVRHVVFLFLVAALIAILLNPLVRGVARLWVPRGLAVAIVYLSFAAAMVVVAIALGTVVVDQTRSAANRINHYFTVESGHPRETGAEHDVDRLQRWLDDHGLRRIQIRKKGRDFVQNIQAGDVQRYTSRAIDFVEGAAISTIRLLFSLVLIVVISIYMLLDMPRLAAAVDRRFPPAPNSPPLMSRVEAALVGYVKGQLLLSLIMGASAGVGLWLLGVLGWLPGGDRYALVFGSWVAVTELIPYLGPWLGALPPAIYALVVHPLSAVWVVLLFLAIHQIEGHIVVPNVMGSVLRLHPLLVIFGLLAGGEIYGLPGALIALPLLAAGRALWEFFSERISLESWVGERAVPVEVELEPGEAEAARARVSPLPPQDPPAAASR